MDGLAKQSIRAVSRTHENLLNSEEYWESVYKVETGYQRAARLINDHGE
jgi:hypothetical protein